MGNKYLPGGLKKGMRNCIVGQGLVDEPKLRFFLD